MHHHQHFILFKFQFCNFKWSLLYRFAILKWFSVSLEHFAQMLYGGSDMHFNSFIFFVFLFLHLLVFGGIKSSTYVGMWGGWGVKPPRRPKFSDPPCFWEIFQNLFNENFDDGAEILTQFILISGIDPKTE